MSSTVRFLHHPTSQPCRAVHQFMLENEIPFEEEVVNLMDGSNEQQSFKDQYNPTGQVPILCDGDFVVWESSAIAFYLNEKFKAPANWFGATAQKKGHHSAILPLARVIPSPRRRRVFLYALRRMHLGQERLFQGNRKG